MDDTQTRSGDTLRQDGPHRLVESASATNSPDNSSGPFAVVLTVVVLVALVALLSLASGWIAGLAGRLSSESSGTQDPLGQWLDEDPWEDGSIDDQGNDAPATPSQDYSAHDALALNFGFFDQSIRDGVSASDYARADASVSSYVQQLVKVDADHNDQLVSALRTAYRHGLADSRDDQALASDLDQASETCADARGALDAIQVPDNEAASQYLEEAREQADARWEALGSLVSSLAQSDSHSAEELQDADDQINDATDQAAQALTQALAASRS